MGANLRTLFVVDVEATCWDDIEDQAGQPNEIIEIGVAVLDMKTRHVVQKVSIGVKPRTTKVSEFCTQLTGWTQEQVDKNLDIVEALEEFKRLLNPTSNHLWASYGEYDRYKLGGSTTGGVGELYGINSPFDKLRGHLNIKTLMALKHNFRKEIGLARAVAYYGLQFEGRHHNGADDAVNIAKVASKVLS